MNKFFPFRVGRYLKGEQKHWTRVATLASLSILLKIPPKYNYMLHTIKIGSGISWKIQFMKHMIYLGASVIVLKKLFCSKDCQPFPILASVYRFIDNMHVWADDKFYFFICNASNWAVWRENIASNLLSCKASDHTASHESSLGATGLVRRTWLFLVAGTYASEFSEGMYHFQDTAQKWSHSVGESCFQCTSSYTGLLDFKLVIIWTALWPFLTN